MEYSPIWVLKGHGNQISISSTVWELCYLIFILPRWGITHTNTESLLNDLQELVSIERLAKPIFFFYARLPKAGDVCRPLTRCTLITG